VPTGQGDLRVEFEAPRVMLATPTSNLQNSFLQKSVYRTVLILSVVYLVLTGWNLNLQHVVSPDEPRYACAARNMIKTGDLVIPVFNSRPRLEKPVLFHWMLVFCGTVTSWLGISLDTMGFRLVPLFAGWAGVIALYLLGRRLLNERGAFLACLILTTCYHFHNTARELVVDMTLSTCLLWSWLFFHIALSRIERGVSALLPLLGFYLCLGCACMTKGPFLVGIFSTVPILVYLIWTKNVSVLRHAGIWWGMPLSMTIGLSWFLAVNNRGYDPTPFFSVENFARYLGRKDHIHYLPLFYYIISLPLIYAPWIAALPFVTLWTWRVFRRWRSHGEMLSNETKMAACALGIGFLIVACSCSKRHLYVIPLFPWLALWTAWYFERALLQKENLKAPSFVSPLLLVLAGATLAAFGYGVFWLPQLGGLPFEQALCFVLGLLIAACLFLSARAIQVRNYVRVTSCAVAAAAALIIGKEGIVCPIHERDLNLTEFYSGVSTKLGDRKLVIVGTNSNEASWYLEKTPGPIDEIHTANMKDGFFGAPSTAMLISVSILNRMPLLAKSVTRISDEFIRNKAAFVLVMPDPNNPPDPALFKTRVPITTPGFFDNL
jgi:4-amino-4-deoxy-L-arabinose transferase-like glycosyltransferase